MRTNGRQNRAANEDFSNSDFNCGGESLLEVRRGIIVKGFCND